jgi:heterodisulfide reductase subunit B
MAWIVYLNCLKDKGGRIYEWKAEEMVFPINKALRKYFGSRAYKEKVKKTQERLKFNIDWICYKKQIEKEGLEKLP